MFGSKTKAVNDVDTHKNGTTLICAETSVNGDINFTGTVYIEGCVRGNITSESGLLNISHTAIIEGDIQAERVIIDGRVNGNVYALAHLELAARAVIVGNVHYNVIEMAKGSQVNGSLEHSTQAAMSESRPLLESTALEPDGILN